MKRAFLFPAFLLTLTLTLPLSLPLHAQHSIQGHVIDGETNTPLPGANVFIAKTTKGVSTNVDGSFVITGLPALHFQLVISFIGYQTQVLEVVPGQPISYKIILKPAANRLSEIVVRSRSSRNEWLANLALFKEHFIGLSENSKLCTIENQDILDFDKKDNVLTASADTAVYIMNKGLGYRLKILINKYEYHQTSVHLYYQGNLVFQPLTPADETERKLWAKNRLKAYRGSEMHFFRAVYHRRILEEGFIFNLVHEVHHPKGEPTLEGISDTTFAMRSAIYNNRKYKVSTLNKYSHILDSISTPEKPVLNYTDLLEVRYIQEAEGFAYNRYHNLDGGVTTPQRSLATLHTPAIVEPTGQLYPQDAIETKGYWSWELIAESLPLDYDPAEDIKITEEK
ncbi:MAG TPA: carboxypeptidase-like regulatory domain-containing protein [Cyclobacteriaceae bacterium]|nr:carboxypeptidase-like regulatory domain-containing protein [Cyclobacteriaceae bacterium]